jgi:hypothetical protein
MACYLCFKFHIFNRPILEKYVAMVEGWPCDATPHSLKDKTSENGSIENMSLKMKTLEEGVRVCSLTHNTSGVKGRDGTLGWGFKKMTSESIIHTNLHKLNNKLVSV